MRRVVECTVFGLPMPAGSKTVGRAKSGKTFVRDAAKNSAPWKRQVAQVVGAMMLGSPLLDGPLRLTVRFIRPRPQAHYRTNGDVKPKAPRFPTSAPDTTKLIRAVEDAMQSVVYLNDAQIVDQIATKEYGVPARAEIRVEQL